MLDRKPKALPDESKVAQCTPHTQAMLDAMNSPLATQSLALVEMLDGPLDELEKALQTLRSNAAKVALHEKDGTIKSDVSRMDMRYGRATDLLRMIRRNAHTLAELMQRTDPDASAIVQKAVRRGYTEPRAK